MARMHYNELRWLTPDARDAISIFIQRLSAMNLSPKVAETYRPQATQDKYVAKSAVLVSQGKAPVTKTSHSWHSVGRAADIDISPSDLTNILAYLDLARDLGLHTIADPDKVRAAQADGNRAALNNALWDWHHVEFRNGRTYDKAKIEYAALLKRGPSTGPELAELVSGALTLGAISSVLKNGNL